MNHPQESQRVVADEPSTRGVLGGQDAPTTDEIDEVVELKDNLCMGPWKMGNHAHFPQDCKYCMLTPHSQLVVCMSR